MQLISDLLPVIVFFTVYKFFGIYFATSVAILTVCLQWAWFKYRKIKISQLQYFGFGAIIFLGGLTLLFHNELFIKWKPTFINWAFAAVFFIYPLIKKEAFIKILLKQAIELPRTVWNKLNFAWGLFFFIMGAINIFVVYHFDTNAWVNFKLFGNLGLTFVFVILQSIYLHKHIIEVEK